MTDSARKPERMQDDTHKEWVTAAAAAREAGCSRLTLMHEALHGELVTDQRAGFWFVERASLDAFIARRRAAKPMKKAKARR